MSSNAGTISPQPQCSLEATVTTANAAQYLSLFRKYMFHRDYILEHCSPGLVPVWREVLTMMKVVVYLSEQRGSIQLFLIKDINAFLLDNETMPLDKDVFSSPGSPTSPTAAAAASAVSTSPSTTPEPNKQQQYPIRASKSFQTITKSFKNSFRNRSASSPAFASDEFSFTPPSPTLNQGVLSPATPGSLLSSSSPTPGSSSHARLGPSPLATSPPSTPSSLGDEAADDHTHSHSHQSQHHRSNSSGSLISKIFKSRSFDFKSVREPNADTRAVEERIEKAIAECVTDDDLNEPEPLETDRLSPLPKGSLARRKRSVSVSGGKAPEDLTSGNISPLPPVVQQQPESPLPRLRRCSSVRFSSPPAGMKRSPSATSQNSLASAFSPPTSATKTLLDLFSMGKEDELERSNSDESFSLFGPKPTEKDLAKEHMIKSSYRYHMRRRAVCLFHNEDIEANIEDPPRPSRSS